MATRHVTSYLVALAASLVWTPSAAAQTFAVEQEILAPDGATRFGLRQSVDGSTLAVSAFEEAVDGVAGAGAVYVYTKQNGQWTLQQRIAESGNRRNFGQAIDLSGDTLAIGELDSRATTSPGRVWVYTRASGVWTQQAVLQAPVPPPAGQSDLFGFVLSLDGDSLVVSRGVTNGGVFAFERTGSTWTTGTEIRVNNQRMGAYWLDVSDATLCVGVEVSQSAGMLRLFGRVGGAWSLEHEAAGTGQEGLGGSCAVSGDTALASRGVGGARAFLRTGSTWSAQQTFQAVGSTGAVVLAGDVAILGAIDSNPQIFGRAGATWSFRQELDNGAFPLVAFDGTTIVTHRFVQGVEAAVTFSTSATPPPPTGPPGAPSNVSATVNGNTLSLTWGAPPTGAPPTSYAVLARTSAGAPPLVTMPVGTAMRFDAAAPNGTFLLSVRAANAAGTGPESSLVTATVPSTIPPPGAPSNLVATVSGSTIAFTWTPPTSGGPVAGYVLVAGLAPGFAQPIATVPLGPSPSLSAPGVPAGTYYVRVAAQNGGGTSAPSAEVVVTVTPAQPPGAPTLMASASGSTATLSWAAGSGGVPTVYSLSATTPGGAPIATVPLTGVSVSFGNVPSGTYVLRLTATNAAGPSPPSAPVTLVVP